MGAVKQGTALEDESLFGRLLVKAAITFAPSVDAPRLEVSGHMLDEHGRPDLVALFEAGDPPRMSKPATSTARAKNTPAPAAKCGRRTALDASMPIRVALAGVREHGTFAANGISTLQDASTFSEAELTAIPDGGPGLLTALKDALPRASLALHQRQRNGRAGADNDGQAVPGRDNGT